MKGFDVLNVKSAVKSRSNLDLSNYHATTLEIGQIVPLWFKETIPGGDDFDVNPVIFARLAAMVKPTFGKFSFKTVTAYVPYHMIAADAEAWLAGKTTWEGVTPHGRFFTLSILHTFIANYCCTTTDATSTNTKYTFIDANGNTVYNLFTPAGKYYVKVLNCLGYALPSGVDLRPSSIWATRLSSKLISAYPFLAFVKLYNDYMSQSQRFNTSSLSNALNAIKYGRTLATVWNSGNGVISAQGIGIMFQSVLLCYENDYFTSAWQSANNPLSSVENVSTMDIPQADIAGSPSQITDATRFNYISTSSLANLTRISQRALDFLNSFENWVRRNNYSGSRAVQQLYSRFGVKSEDYRDHYAHILKVDEMPVQVGDVTATADTSAVPLGDYAGKGIISSSDGSNHKVRIEASEFGMAFIIGFITVKPMNSYGFDRAVLRTEPLDYYNPEFDGLGADAISVGEFMTDPITANQTVMDDDTYGFTERYNSYRYGRDMITGDFRDFHKDAEMACWHLGRNLIDVRSAGYLVAQNTAVATMPQYGSEYNRIFAVTGDDYDHFYAICVFGVDADRPIMNLNQVVNLGQGNLSVPRNGNVIS